MATPNTLVLEDTMGRVREVHEGVSDDDLVTTFDAMCDRAAGIACPIIFVNGRGYTNRKEFIEAIQIVNEFSVNAGGCAIYA